MKFASVIIDQKINLYNTYTYYIPEELEDSIFIGCPVLICFGNRKDLIDGYVIDIDNKTDYDIEKIKPISAVNTNKLSTNDNAISLGIYISKFYGYPLSKAINLVMPVKKKIKYKVKRTVTSLIEDEKIDEKIEYENKKNAKRRVKLLQELKKNKSLDFSYLINEAKLDKSVIDKCASLGYIYVEEVKTDKINFDNLSLNKYNYIGGCNLSSEQYKIYKDILLSDVSKPCLLHGVTGSGKTEIYIELIKDALMRGRDSIVLVPEISLTYQLIGRFYSVFGDLIAVLNSSLSDGEKYEQTENIINNKAKIIIGPRSALFAPFNNLGLIIIDEEHDNSYKNEGTPSYDTRELAIHLSKITSSRLVLGSATPDLNSYTRALNDEYNLFSLYTRANNASLPLVHIVDMREELKQKNLSIFSNKLNELIIDRINKKEQIILYINRRGYSLFLSCRECGKVVMCPNCDVSLTIHNDGYMRCHYCGYSSRVVNRCPGCNSSSISSFGVGTQKLEEYTKKMYPKARVLRLDSDNTIKKNSSRIIIEKFKNKEADILIGTQMVVKGHDFSNVSLVGVVMADTSLFVNSYDSGERTFQSLTQVAGRSGRGDIKGDVVIQTYNPNHHAVLLAGQQDYVEFYKKEIVYRKLASYPPVCKMMQIQLSSKHEDKLIYISNKALEKLNDINHKENFNAVIIGPVSDNIYKLNNFYRKKIYIKHIEYDILLKIKKLFDESINIKILKYISFNYTFNI